MKDFCFRMFNSKTKFLKKNGDHIIATKEQRIQKGKGFALGTEETIVNER